MIIVLNLIALNRLYNQALYEISEVNSDVLNDAEDRKAIIDDAITKVGAGIDGAYQVVDLLEKGELDTLAVAKTVYDYKVDTSKLPDDYKPALKLASTVAYDCIAKKILKVVH